MEEIVSSGSESESQSLLEGNSKGHVMSETLMDELDARIRQAETLVTPGNAELMEIIYNLDRVGTHLRPQEVPTSMKHLSLTELTANILKAQAELTVNSMQDTSWTAILQNLALNYPPLRSESMGNRQQGTAKSSPDSRTGKSGSTVEPRNSNAEPSSTYQNQDEPNDPGDASTNRKGMLYPLDLVALGKALAPGLLAPRMFTLSHAATFWETDETEKLARKRIHRQSQDRANPKEPSQLIKPTAIKPKDMVDLVQEDTTIERMERLYERLKQLNMNANNRMPVESFQSNNHSAEYFTLEHSHGLRLIPVPLCFLCLDPNSYARTVENFFDLECLIRNQRATKRIIHNQSEREKIYQVLGIKLESKEAKLDTVFIVCDLNKKSDKHHAGESKSEWDPATLLGDTSCLTLTHAIWKKALKNFGIVP